MKKYQQLFERLTKLAKLRMVLALYALGSTMNIAVAQNWNELNKIVASDRDALDAFGSSVAISGDYAIVGASSEGDGGAAYIFKNNAGTWLEVQKIVASDRELADSFGHIVAISGDYAIVGAYLEDEDTEGENTLSEAGSAYIFKNDGGTWTEVQKIVASDRDQFDNFGQAVSISGDYAIVGALQESHDTIGENWKPSAGSAYIFKNEEGTWSEVQKIVASDRDTDAKFGWSVAISGDYAIIGAAFENRDENGGAYLLQAGSAYIFNNNAGTWSEVQKIVASDRDASDWFGLSVAISGDYAIVGAPSEDHDTTGQSYLISAGSAYIFENNTGTWSEVQKVVASDRGIADEFGVSVAISGDYAVVGARHEDEDATGQSYLINAGSAYIFEKNTGTWSEAQKIVASDRGEIDQFGWSVAISGDYTIVGAFFEDENSTGGAFLNNAGSAYIFKKGSVLGMVEKDFGNVLLAYPNPTNGELTILSEKEFSDVQLTVRNILGQAVIYKQYSADNQINLTFEGAPGVYFIEIFDDGKIATLKVIKE